jgi:hypothetical protein
MPKYEYFIKDFHGSLMSPLTGHPEESIEEWEDELNEYAKKGWRLIAVISPPLSMLGAATLIRLFFERPTNFIDKGRPRGRS